MHTNTVSNLCHGLKTCTKNNCTTLKFTVSKKTISILQVLLNEGFIRGYFIETENNKKFIIALLKLLPDQNFFARLRVIKLSKKTSFTNFKKLKNNSNGFNLSILSTKKGVMSNVEALKSKIGGVKLVDIT